MRKNKIDLTRLLYYLYLLAHTQLLIHCPVTQNMNSIHTFKANRMRSDSTKSSLTACTITIKLVRKIHNSAKQSAIQVSHIDFVSL